jgi:hypothetical protein
MVAKINTSRNRFPEKLLCGHPVKEIGTDRKNQILSDMLLELAQRQETSQHNRSLGVPIMVIGKDLMFGNKTHVHTLIIPHLQRKKQTIRIKARIFYIFSSHICSSPI